MKLTTAIRPLIYTLSISSLCIALLTACNNASAPEATKKPIDEATVVSESNDTQADSIIEDEPIYEINSSENSIKQTSYDSVEDNKTIVTATAGSASATGEIAHSE